jgi:rRNA maturation endonuclease Nob1
MMGPNSQGQWVNYNNRCPKCQKHLPLPEYADKCCPNCGQNQPDPMKRQEAVQPPACSCGHQPNPDDKFCIQCGKSLQSTPSPQGG